MKYFVINEFTLGLNPDQFRYKIYYVKRVIARCSFKASGHYIIVKKNYN